MLVSGQSNRTKVIHEPILKPYLNRPLSHVNVCSDAFAHGCCGCWVLVKLDLQRDELFLSGPLTLLIFLLLREGAFTWWTTGSIVAWS